MIRSALRAGSLLALPLLQLLFVSACSSEGRNLGSVSSTIDASQPGAAQSAEGWLSHLNFYRATAYLSPVTENTAWSDGDRKHSIYMVKTDALQHGEYSNNTWYTPEGQTAARQSNLFMSSNRDDTDARIIDTWMQSPFHAIGLLDPRLVQVGFGSHREAHGRRATGAAMNVIAGIHHTTKATYPIFWPGAGTTIPIGLHWGEYPSPLTSCPGYAVPSGLPLILQIGAGDLTPVVSTTSFTRNGQPLQHCVFDETTYNNPDRRQQRLGRNILGARDAIVLIPRAPLSPGTTYTASITANGHAYTWSFSIGSTTPSRDRQNLSD